MISRIETIDDFGIWLKSIATLDKKNVALKDQLQARQISILLQAHEILLEIKPLFPDSFKQCIKCQAIYPATKEWFDWNGRGRDGLNSICKFCRNAYQKKHKSRGHKSPYSSADQEELKQHFPDGDY